MRKNFLMLGAAIAALTSCTESEVLNVAQNRAIGFESFVDKATRATNDIGSTSTDFAEFYVFCAKGAMNGDTFTPDTESNGNFYLDHVMVSGGPGKWEYNPHKPWINDKSFRFAAYTNGKGDGTQSAAKLEDEMIEFIPEEAYTVEGTTYHVWGLNINDYEVGEEDLMVAVPGMKTVGDITEAPPSVGLTFKHVLAKIIVQFRYTANSQNEDLKLVIEPFSYQAYKTGDCKARYTGIEENTTIGAQWTTTGDKEAYDVFGLITEEVDGVAVSKKHEWTAGNIQSESYVIPQSNADIVIPEIVINTVNGDGQITSTKAFTNVSLAIADHTDWKPGYIYRYVADITPGEHYIHFTTSVTTWIDDDSRNQTIK